MQQMHWTHNVKGDWFVPLSVAVAEITPEQANWKDKSGNHSISELVHHLAFWDERNLRTFNGEKLPKFTADNDTTFHSDLTWEATVKKLDQVLGDWEKAIEGADDPKLQKWHSTIDNLVAHNAYHTGEIVYIRRQQGSWNPDAGVH
jgi:uncharacterized damage-inducible protein DinB